MAVKGMRELTAESYFAMWGLLDEYWKRLKKTTPNIQGLHSFQLFSKLSAKIEMIRQRSELRELLEKTNGKMNLEQLEKLLDDEERGVAKTLLTDLEIEADKKAGVPESRTL